MGSRPGAFFPLFPAAMHVLGWFGLPLWLGGVVISHVAFFAAMVGLHRLVARRCSARAGYLATWLLALFPAAFVFSLVYPSSLFLAASVWAFVLVDEHREPGGRSADGSRDADSPERDRCRGRARSPSVS